MTTTVGLRAELEDRPLEDHELEIASGGLPAASQVSTEHTHWSPFQQELWGAIWYRQIHGPLHLAMPAGL
jgi:hypothetical protein